MRILFVLLMVGVTGCTALKSRYAMNDPVYAEKYADGAEQGDLIGKAKQALDARHAEGLGGIYFGGGAQARPNDGTVMGGGEIGIEQYLMNWCTTRAALAGYFGNPDGFAGVDLGARLQTPTRIAPFVGAGTFVGLSNGMELADRDNQDNDDDFFIDEQGETRSTFDHALAAFYPEVGVHFWFNGNWRLTTFGRYFVTTDGRERDDWLLGLQLAAFAR